MSKMKRTTISLSGDALARAEKETARLRKETGIVDLSLSSVVEAVFCEGMDAREKRKAVKP